jgi:hypothetical protein
MKIYTLAFASLLSVVLFGACSGPRPGGPGYGCFGGGEGCQSYAECCSGNCSGISRSADGAPS